MLRFFKRYPHLLLFGMLTASFSSPGQTFLISFFIGPMKEALEVSASRIAAIYSLATLASALILPFLGRLLDRLRLVTFTLAAGLLLAIGCLVLSGSHGWLSLLIGFFLIRNLGQGGLTLISSTTMARVFGSMRGKALAIANLGYPLGEALFPFLVASWVLTYGWRSGWIFLAVLLLLFFSPAAWLLLRRSRHDHAVRVFLRHGRLRQKKTVRRKGGALGGDWRVRGILKDWRFYALQFPAILSPAFLTAVFFHQTALLEWKNWSLQLASAGFVAFAVCRGGVSLLIGPLADHFSARALFPFVLFPLAGGLLTLLYGQKSFWIFFYLGLAGCTMGLSMTLTSALWAELYGTKYLGSLKGIQAALMVVSTALAPFIFGVGLEHLETPALMIGGMTGSIFFGALIAGIVCWRFGSTGFYGNKSKRC